MVPLCKHLPCGMLYLGLVLPTHVAAQALRQTQTDSYTRYELQDPATQSFRIYYDVSATTPGARHYFNTIREGADEAVHGVTDRMTGEPLQWTMVDGAEARRSGHPTAHLESRYIKVRLARPVPKGGQGRIRIDKTYRDPESYWSDGDRLTFSRSLGIKRNAVVLPAGYEVVGCNYPSQVATEENGRLKVSFVNPGPGSIPYVVEARRFRQRQLQPAHADEHVGQAVLGAPVVLQTASPSPQAGYSFTERARENRDIVYILQQPETHSFRLYHDYTESRVGVDRYLNVVRRGSKASDPSATILDTGEQLRIETLQGREIADRGLSLSGEITPETEVVVIWFDPVREGHSVRLRIEETYTDRNRYFLLGDELVWDRTFGRSRNTVVLPDGWRITANAIPAVISETEDDKVQLRYVNDRPGGIDVFLKAQRR